MTRRNTHGRLATLRAFTLTLAYLAPVLGVAPAAAFKIPCRDWDVTIRIREASAPPQALQFRIDYVDSRGLFLGSGGDVECRNRIAGSLFDANDNEADKWVRTSTISLTDFPSPGPVATCLFREYSSDEPSSDDLHLVVEAASDGQLNDIDVSARLRFAPAGDLTECEDRCGDGFVDDRYETCDDANTIEWDSCPSNCGPPTCGNGAIDADYEECDDGNTVATDDCLASCLPARCGDGVIWQGHEQCDDGNSNDGDGCASNCRPPNCGDGVVEFPEECDDQNLDDYDGCLSSCYLAFCGDGLRHTSAEACDDGNTSSDDACTSECKRATCGDGFVFAGVEECDDGNRTEDVSCPADCGALHQCGSPIADGRLVASDAWRILWAAVGRDDECPTWACDVDSSGTVQTSDSLRVLRRAVGQPITLICGPPTFLQIRLLAQGNVSALEFDIDHSDAAAELVMEGGSPTCESLVEGSSMTFEAPEDSVLRVTAALEAGFGDRQSIARCAIVQSGQLSPRDFPATIIQANAPGGTPVAGVAVRAVPY